MAHRLFDTFREIFSSSGELGYSFCVLRTISQPPFNLSTVCCEAETKVTGCLINLNCFCWSLYASANESNIDSTLQSDFHSASKFQILTEQHRIPTTLGILYRTMNRILFRKHLLILYEDICFNSPRKYVHFICCKCQEKVYVHSQYFPKPAESKPMLLASPTAPPKEAWNNYLCPTCP